MIKGSIVHRVIRGKDRYYHQWREDGRTRSRYLKADEVLPLRIALAAQQKRAPKARKQPSALRKTDHIGEIAYGTRKAAKRECIDEIISFIRKPDDSRILILHGLPGSGKTTIIRQALGRLTPAERADICLRTLPFPTEAYRPLVPVDTTALTFREFVAREKDAGIVDFIERGGPPCNPFTDSAAARAFVSQVAGPDDWRTLEDLTLSFLHSALSARHPQGAHHARTRTAIGRQKLIAALDDLRAQRPADEAATARLVDLGLLVRLRVETLRPEFSRTDAPFFTQTGLRFAVAQSVLTSILEGKTLSSLGAAERKMVRDAALGDIREQILEDAIFLETCRRRISDGIAVVRVEAGANRLGMVIADRGELTCELYETHLTDQRESQHLEHLTDYRFLDAIEHRYGTVTERIVLYNGRDARHPSGVSYRNVRAFLSQP